MGFIHKGKLAGRDVEIAVVEDFPLRMSLFKNGEHYPLSVAGLSTEDYKRIVENGQFSTMYQEVIPRNSSVIPILGRLIHNLSCVSTAWAAVYSQPMPGYPHLVRVYPQQIAIYPPVPLSQDAIFHSGMHFFKQVAHVFSPSSEGLCTTYRSFIQRLFSFAGAFSRSYPQEKAGYPQFLGGYPQKCPVIGKSPKK